ncbi:MAG: hypothetical protein L0H25_08075 [Micrococcales bacterium]|nr:hypothetical protein [Micrococcales bacterium]
MSVAEQAVRAPAVHRAVAGLASPVIGYFVARLILHWTTLPAPVTYAVCLATSLALAWRAWSARVVLGEDDLTIVNTLASTSIARAQVRRITDAGRIEPRSDNGRPASRLLVEALRPPWWTLRTGRHQYSLNREQIRSWLRVPPARRSVGRDKAPGDGPDLSPWQS